MEPTQITRTQALPLQAAASVQTPDPGLRIDPSPRACCSVFFWLDPRGNVVAPDQGEQLVRLFRADRKCGAVKFLFCRIKYRLHLLARKFPGADQSRDQVLREQEVGKTKGLKVNRDGFSHGMPPALVVSNAVKSSPGPRGHALTMLRVVK